MRILIISKLFPPDNAARALQISKVVEALKKNNCEPFVIAGYAKNIKKQNKFKKNNSLCPIKYVSYDENNTSEIFIKRALNRLKSEIMSVNLHSKWVRKTYYQSIQVIKIFQPEIIFTSSSPFESHLVGLLIKRKKKIPWISSFSDPWPSCIEPYPYNVYDIPFLRIFQMHKLKRVLKNSNAIHMTNKIVCEIFQQESNISILEKCFVIPHIASEVTIQKNKIRKECIAYVGNLSRERLSEPVFNALKYLVLNHNDYIKYLLIVGNVCKEFEEFKKKLKIDFFIKETGYKPSDEAAKIAASCEILLLIEADMDYSPYLPSKFADYASTGRPIIAVTPEKSPVREYLQRYGGGYAVSHNESEIVRAIKKLFTGKSITELTANKSQSQDISQIFNAESVARLYVQMFQKVKKNGYSQQNDSWKNLF